MINTMLQMVYGTIREMCMRRHPSDHKKSRLTVAAIDTNKITTRTTLWIGWIYSWKSTMKWNSSNAYTHITDWLISYFGRHTLRRLFPSKNFQECQTWKIQITHRVSEKNIHSYYWLL